MRRQPMLGPCGFEAFVMRDIHRVDEDVPHVGLPALLDVVPGLGNVGLLLLCLLYTSDAADD